MRPGTFCAVLSLDGDADINKLVKQGYAREWQDLTPAKIIDGRVLWTRVEDELHVWFRVHPRPAIVV